MLAGGEQSAFDCRYLQLLRGKAHQNGFKLLDGGCQRGGLHVCLRLHLLLHLSEVLSVLILHLLQDQVLAVLVVAELRGQHVVDFG